MAATNRVAERRERVATLTAAGIDVRAIAINEGVPAETIYRDLRRINGTHPLACDTCGAPLAGHEPFGPCFAQARGVADPLEALRRGLFPRPVGGEAFRRGHLAAAD